MKGTVYGLFDAGLNEIRYIGQTTNLEKRLGEHASRSKTSKIKIYCWWRSANSVECVVLAERQFVCKQEMKRWLDLQEAWFISAYKGDGHRLTNLTNGGEGTVGYTPTSITRDRLRASHVGKVHTAETRLKMSESRKGEKHPGWGKPGPNLGKQMSESSKQKLSRSRLGIGARLTDEQVTLILLDWRTHQEIADDYGCSRSYVSQIKSGARNTESRKCA